jgi:hypothetical protein
MLINGIMLNSIQFQFHEIEILERLKRYPQANTLPYK